MSETIFDDDGICCEVCGLDLYEGRCPECDGPGEELVSFRIISFDWRGGWRFAAWCVLPLSLMVFAGSAVTAAVIGAVSLVLWLGCKLGLQQYRAGAAADSPETGARR